MSSTRLSISLPSSNHEKLAEIADQHDVSVAWLIRLAVVQLLENVERDQQIALPLSPSPKSKVELS